MSVVNRSFHYNDDDDDNENNNDNDNKNYDNKNNNNNFDNNDNNNHALTAIMSFFEDAFGWTLFLQMTSFPWTWIRHLRTFGCLLILQMMS